MDVLSSSQVAAVLGLERQKQLLGCSGANDCMAEFADVCLKVPSTVTARIQEVHLCLGHLLCALVEDALGV